MSGSGEKCETYNRSMHRRFCGDDLRRVMEWEMMAIRVSTSECGVVGAMIIT